MEIKGFNEFVKGFGEFINTEISLLAIIEDYSIRRMIKIERRY